MNKYHVSKINEYTREDGVCTLRALEQQETEDNIRAAKQFLRGILLLAVLVGGILGITGCDPVCGTADTKPCATVVTELVK